MLVRILLVEMALSACVGLDMTFTNKTRGSSFISSNEKEFQLRNQDTTQKKAAHQGKDSWARMIRKAQPLLSVVCSCCWKGEYMLAS